MDEEAAQKISASLDHRLFRQCEAVYDYLWTNADPQGLWIGHKTHILEAVGFPRSYHSRVFGTLQTLGCVEQVATGRKGSPTVLQLRHAPELDAYLSVLTSLPHKTGLTPRVKTSTLLAEIEAIEERLPSVDLNSYIASIEQRLADFDSRLALVERRVTHGETEKGTET